MSTTAPRITRIVTLPARLAARVDGLVDDPSSAYDSFSAVVEVALRNHFELERGPETTPKRGELGAESAMAVGRDHTWPSAVMVEPSHDLLRIPTAEPDDLAPAPSAHEVGPLTFLSNRLNPVPIVVRVVANSGAAKPADVGAELDHVAREIGLRLKTQDAQAPVPGRRLVTSWPVGTDLRKSAEKFRASYFIDHNGRGCLRNLGLAQVVAGRLQLTKDGYELSQAPCPLLGETEDGVVVGAEARDILARAVLSNPHERALLMVFFTAFNDGTASQAVIDRAFTRTYGWNDALTASQRAAVIGRLRDLELLDSDGRGPAATVRATSTGRTFMTRVLNNENAMEEEA